MIEILYGLANQEINLSKNAKRYLLDTNIWRYFIDAQQEQKLVDLASSGKALIQICPATVNETLQLRDLRLMTKIVRLQTKPCFDRLRPEVLVNSIDLINEIYRLHPDWLLRVPDQKSFKKWIVFWDKKWWSRVRKLPAAEARDLKIWNGNIVNLVRDQAKFRRAEIRKNRTSSKLPLNGWKAKVPKPFPGWDKNLEVDAWRIATLISLTNSLIAHQNGMYPIMETFIDFSKGLLTSDKWKYFWLYEIEKENCPRFWLEWAHVHTSSFRKITPGTPGDTQLFQYLIDTDVFVSADKAMLDIIEEVRPWTNRSLPEVLKLSGGGKGVEEFFQKI